jgi:exosortase
MITASRAASEVRGGLLAAGRYLPGVVGLAVWIAAFLPTWREWAPLWRSDPQYEHGPLLAGLNAVLIARSLAAESVTIRPWAAPLWASALAAASALWWAAWLIGAAVPQQVLVVCCGWLAIRTAFGREAARESAFPVLGMLLASEVWSYPAILLQHIAAHVVTWLLALGDFPVRLVGDRIITPAGEFVVAEGCSGVKYLVTMLIVTGFVIRFGRYGRGAGVTLVATGVAAAIVANWIRIVALICIGEATHLRSPLMHDHYFFGWVLFCLALVPIVILAIRPQREPADLARPRVTGEAPPAAAPHRAFAITLLALLCGPVAAAVVEWRADAATKPVELITSTGDWRREGRLEPDAATPRRASDATRLGSGDPRGLARFESPRGTVEAGAARLRLPISSEALERLTRIPRGPRATLLVGERRGTLGRADKSVIRFSESELAAPDTKRKIVRYWFLTGGRFYSRSSRAKLAAAAQALAGQGQMTVFVAESDCPRECASARALLDDFMRALTL